MRRYALGPLAVLAGAATLRVTSPGPPPGELPRYLLTFWRFARRNRRPCRSPDHPPANWG